MTETKNDKHPTHTIYKVVGDGAGGKWTKVGVGFTHKDGLGLALVFDGIPTEGRRRGATPASNIVSDRSGF